MPENEDAGNGGQEKTADEFKPITSQEEFERALGKRLERERSKFADYDDLKAKAAQVDAAEEAKKTELEKAQERIAELEKTTAAATRAALVTRIAAEEGVIPEVLTGSTEEEMRAAAKRVLEWRDSNKRTTPQPKKLASGSSSAEPKTGEKGRAAAALRTLRQG